MSKLDTLLKKLEKTIEKKSSNTSYITKPNYIFNNKGELNDTFKNILSNFDGVEIQSIRENNNNSPVVEILKRDDTQLQLTFNNKSVKIKSDSNTIKQKYQQKPKQFIESLEDKIN